MPHNPYLLLDKNAVLCEKQSLSFSGLPLRAAGDLECSFVALLVAPPHVLPCLAGSAFALRPRVGSLTELLCEPPQTRRAWADALFGPFEPLRGSQTREHE